MDAIGKTSDLQVVASLQGDWTEEKAYEETKRWLAEHPDSRINLVFGANDRTAMGARKAFTQSTSDIQQIPLFCGIDGLPGEDGGIQLVRDSLLEASYIYPTHGDQIIDLAINILEGKPYPKETMLMSALVTHENAKVLLMESEELLRQAHQLEELHERADNYLHELGTQRAINWLVIGVIILLLIVFILFYVSHLRKIAMQRERVVNTLWELPNAKELAATQPEEENASTEKKEEPAFITRFKEVIEARLADSDTSVEDLAADMNLSRVQLYRKVKTISGSSPVEVLRTARLKRGYHLLISTDMSVSEITYAVGFTSPSYFTKCFREEYGILPGDVRKN